MDIKQNITTVNRSVLNRTAEDIQYIVVHYVGGVSTAHNNASYFKDVYRGASAHYFLDEKGIWQCVLDKDAAWHCGTEPGKMYWHPDCRNYNSIGVELCCKKDSSGSWYFEPEAVKNAVWLVSILAKQYGLTTGQILRHYDVTGKSCPEPWVRDPNAWTNFKDEVMKEMAGVPEWQKDALAKLVLAGVIQSPDYWRDKLGETATVGEIMGIMANLLEVAKK